MGRGDRTPGLVAVKQDACGRLSTEHEQTPRIDLDQSAFDDLREFAGCHPASIDVGTSRRMKILDEPAAVVARTKRGVPSRDPRVRQQNVRVATSPEDRRPIEIMDLFLKARGFGVS